MDAERRVTSALDVLFSPVRPWRAGLLRIALGAVLTGHFLPVVGRRLADLVMLPASWWGLAWAGGGLLPPPTVLPTGWAPAAVAATSGLGAAATLGVLTRITTPLFAFSCFVLCGWEAGAGFFDHEATLAAVSLGVISLAPGADALSVDRARAAARCAPGRRWGALVGPAVPGWGPRVCLVALLGVYLAAGIAKLRFGGVGWLDGQTLGFYFSGRAASVSRALLAATDAGSGAGAWRDGLGLTDHLWLGLATPRARWLASVPGAMATMATSGTLLELSAPLCLLSARLRTFYLLAMVAFHALNGALLHLPFLGYQVLCVLLLPAGRWDAPPEPEGVPDPARAPG